MNQFYQKIFKAVFVMVVLIVANFTELNAQINRCGVDDLTPAQVQAIRDQLNQYYALGKIALSTQISIPVAVHIIRYDNGAGDVSDQTITNQITVLNTGYTATNFQFVLHSISRTNNTVWTTHYMGSANETSMKQSLAVDPSHVLNLYLCAAPTSSNGALLGYATFPQSYPESSYMHGVVIKSSSVPGGSETNYNEGKTATHEIGHYLGLFHTFQNGCSAPGDDVEDTPYEATANTTMCDDSRNTCPSPGNDPIHNYMDYSYDNCYYEFTTGQLDRMDMILPVYKPSLYGVSVTVEQRRENNSLLTGSAIARWENGSTFQNYTVPISPFTLVVGSPATFRGQQTIVNSPDEKYNQWKQDGTAASDVQNHHTFTIEPNTHTLTSQFYPTKNATLQAQLLEGVSASASLEFKDPWLIDFADQNYGYNLRNQGMTAPFKSVTSSANNLGINSTYKGVFLNQNPNYLSNIPGYSVSSEPRDIYLSQTGKTHKFYLQNWSGTNVTFENANLTATKIVFTNDNATINASLKGTQLANISWGGYWNSTSQKKVVMTSDGYLHMVYGSMERVWYEKSTNNGTTWQLMNNGKPLSSNNSYDPSISANGTEVVIVYQEIVGTGNNIMLFHPCGCGTEGNYLLEAEPVNEGRMTPVVALGANNEVMIVWKRTILSGSKNEGLYYKFGHISYDYHFWYSAGNLADMIDPLGNEVNGGSWNPTIEVTKSVTYPARNVFHIAWQQPSGSYSLIYYTKIDVGTNNSLSSTIGVEDVSSGSGYPYNYAPSISLSTTNVVNVVWAAMPYWYSSPRKVFSRTRTTGWSSYFGQYGNSVNSPSVAFYGSSSVIAWSETNGSVYSDKFYKWGSVRTANTTGRDLQIYSTTTLQDMRIVSHSSETLPYSFAQSSDLYNLNKENPLAMCSGVQVVAAQEKTEFYFRIGDISLNGKNVAFKDMNLNAINLSQSDLDYLMTSDVVTLGDADNLGYSIEYGATDTVKALSLLQNNKFISFNVELVDASNDALLYTLNDVKLNGNSSLGLSSESYNIDLSGLSGKQVYFKVKITNNLKPVYYASEIKSDAKVLAKSKTVSLNLSKSIVVKEYDLFQNYPNPFNPVTTINYQLPKSGSVTLKIFDILGNEVMTLVNEQKEMGRYTVQFDASSLASGMYVYQLRVNDYTSTKKMLLLK